MSSGIFESHYLALFLFEKVDLKQDFDYMNCTWRYDYESPIPNCEGNWLYRSYLLNNSNINISIHIRQNRCIYFFIEGLPISFTSFKEIIESFLWRKRLFDLDEFRI